MKYLSFLSAGESHGPQLTIVLQNLPAGLPLSQDDVNHDLARRQRGFGRGGRMQIERDCVRFVGGVRHGATLGSPLAMVIENRDWPNWGQKMAAEPPTEPVEKVTRLRPGHADLAGAIKYAHDDVRNVLERASARETAARVAAGAVARRLLAHFGIEVRSHTVRIGQTEAASPEILRLDPSGSEQAEIRAHWEAVEASEVRCADAQAAARMIEDIRQTRANGNTLGGVFEVVAYRVPIGLGSHTQWDEKLDGRLMQAVGSIHSVKAVELGEALWGASRYGSEVHDPIEWDAALGWRRPTNHAGGLEGGLTTGQPVVVRGFCKPISTLIHPLPSTDLATRQPSPAHVERSDVCVIPAAGVVGEAMVALTLADAFRQKFGGDSVAEIERNYRTYLATYQP
ncbi:MAG: chorismate synthase [Chloroflexi bacterium]|nr:chorismate synthase [Chloroflexota bacterium]